MARTARTRGQVATPGSPAAQARPLGPSRLIYLWPAATIALVSPVLLLLIFLLVVDHVFLLWVLRGFLVLALLATAGFGAAGVAAAFRRWASWTAIEGEQRIALADAMRELPDGLTSYTVHAPRPGGHAQLEAPAAPALPEPAYGADPADGQVVEGLGFETGRPVLEQLRQRGHVARSGVQLLIGHAGARPYYVDTRRFGVMAVGGQTQKGKTNLLQSLAAQAAMMGWGLVLLDPFPEKPDGLIKSLAPLSGHAIRQAASPEEIAASIVWVDQIARRRLSGEPWQAPILVLLDEFSNLVLRRMLAPEVLALLPATGMISATAGVHTVIAGHLWTHQLLGGPFGSALRQSAPFRVALGMSADAAEFLLPTGADARAAAQLRAGQAIFWGDESPVRVDVPWIRQGDLEYAAGGRPPRVYQPWFAPPLSPAQAGPAPSPATPSSARLSAPLSPGPGQAAESPRILAPAPPTVIFAPLPLPDQIVELLTARPWIDADRIAEVLEAKRGSVRNALTDLLKAGRIVARAEGRRNLYAAAGQASAEGGAASP